MSSTKDAGLVSMDMCNKQYSMLGRCFLVHLVLWALMLTQLSLPVWASPTVFVKLSRDLTQQAIKAVANETGPQASERNQAASAMMKTALAASLSDVANKRLDPDARLIGLREAMGEPLASLNLLEVVQCYADSQGNSAGFAKRLQTLAKERSIRINWNSPAVNDAVSRVYRQLGLLKEMYVGVSSHSSYYKNDWNGNVRVTWYPVQGTIYVFSVASVNDSSGMQNVSFCYEGTVKAVKASGPVTGFQVDLSKYTLDISYRKRDFWGQWAETASLLGNNISAASCSMRLTVTGRQVTGRVVETLLVDHDGSPRVRGNVIYSLRGTLLENGIIKGTCTISGDSAALKLRFADSNKTNTADWSGTITGKVAKGVINMEGSPELTWQTRQH